MTSAVPALPSCPAPHLLAIAKGSNAFCDTPLLPRLDVDIVAYQGLMSRPGSRALAGPPDSLCEMAQG